MKPTVMVVGLLPGQVELVRRRCRDLANLKFCSGGHNVRIRGSAEHCVLMVRFVEHGHTNKALATFPRDRVYYNRGGLSELCGIIAGIAAGTAKSARHL